MAVTSRIFLVILFAGGTIGQNKRQTPIFNRQSILEIVNEADRLFNLNTDRLNKLVEGDVSVRPSSSAAAQFSFHQTSNDAMKLGEKAMRVLSTTRQIILRNQWSLEEAAAMLPTISTTEFGLQDTCPPKPQCNPSKYRTLDGSCNNPLDSSLGKSLTVHQRILPAQYADGVFEPRVAATGRPLPSARLVSSSLVRDIDSPRSDITLLLMTFAQFVDHDMNLAPVFTTQKNAGIECCTEEGGFKPELTRHPSCWPIEIPANDPFYAALRRTCMNFVRTVPGPRADCTFGYAEQLEELTHYMDGSQIYGSTDKMAARIRTFNKGLLRTGNTGDADSLPINPKPPAECHAPCFLAGDVRVNENQLLTSMHLVWVREHNRVAKALNRLNPSWNDEKLYQEARRIVIGEYLQITYNELLPIILGKKYIQTFNLDSSQGFSNNYDQNINPSVNAEFSVAAFRMGHNLLQGMVKLFQNRRNTQTVELSNILENGEPYKRAGFSDQVLRSLIRQPIQNMDESVTRQVTTKLFAGNESFGMDLIAINLQRGRDFGIPGYNHYRPICGLPKAQRFEDLAPQIPIATATKLARIYESVDDIDLFIGSTLETLIPGSLVGHVFNCIIGDQFTRFKRGDRFFFSHGGQPHSFKPRQLEQIQRATLSRILCDNSGIQAIQPEALKMVSQGNLETDCNALPRVDLSSWAGEP